MTAADLPVQRRGATTHAKSHAFPPLPDVPACWSWECPMGPLVNSEMTIRKWQDCRCAVCGVHRPNLPHKPGRRWSGLDEDHDHETGDVRGYLCPRCNVRESRCSDPVFDLYRQRPPAKILGILARYGWVEHPLVRQARWNWENAVNERIWALEEQDRLTHLRRCAEQWPDQLDDPFWRYRDKIRESEAKLARHWSRAAPFVPIGYSRAGQ